MGKHSSIRERFQICQWHLSCASESHIVLSHHSFNFTGAIKGRCILKVRQPNKRIKSDSLPLAAYAQR